MNVRSVFALLAIAALSFAPIASSAADFSLHFSNPDPAQGDSFKRSPSAAGIGTETFSASFAEIIDIADSLHSDYRLSTISVMADSNFGATPGLAWDFRIGTTVVNYASIYTGDITGGNQILVSFQLRNIAVTATDISFDLYAPDVQANGDAYENTLSGSERGRFTVPLSSTITFTYKASGNGMSGPAQGTFFVNGAKLPGKNLTVVAGTGGSASGSSTGVPSGYSVNITATADSGYDFAGWLRTSGSAGAFADATKTATSYTMGNDDITVTATFSAIVDPKAKFTKPPFLGSLDGGATPSASFSFVPSKIDKGNSSVASWSRTNSETTTTPSCAQSGAPAVLTSGASVSFETAGLFTYSLSAEPTKPSATVEWEAAKATKVSLTGPGGFSFEGAPAGAVVVFTSGTYSAVAEGPGGASAPATITVTLPAVPATATVTASVEVVAPTTTTPKVTLQSLDGDQGTVSLNKGH